MTDNKTKGEPFSGLPGARWVTHTPSRGPSVRRLVLGRVRVGSVIWDPRVRLDAEPYRPMCRLPSVVDNLGRFAREEDAMRRLEGAVRSWLRAAHLVQEAVLPEDEV